METLIENKVNNKRWLLLLLCLPFIFILVFVNTYVDPANIFHSYSDEIAEAQIKGNDVYIASGTYNERECKKALIDQMPKHVECIAVGPSLMMGINSTQVGTDSFYNLGVSGADMYDMLATFAMLKVNNVTYDRVIICVDSYFFDETLNKNFTRNSTYMNYSEHMLGVLGQGKETAEPQGANFFNKVNTYIQQTFSISYFQAAISKVLAEKKFFNIDGLFFYCGKILDNVQLNIL